MTHRLFLVCSALVAALAVGCAGGGDVPTASSGTDSIINGTATPGLLHLTAAQVNAVGAVLTKNGSAWENGCTATLISPTVVLTAAHCVYDEQAGRDRPASDFRFAVGADAASPSARLAPVAVHSHPDYDPWGDAQYDVAVMLLAPAAIAGLDVAPIVHNCAALTNAGFVGQPAQNVGYGETAGPNGERNSRKWWATEEVTALTAYDFTVGGQGVSGVCYGDSGGPALWDMKTAGVRVVGVLSWGDEECAQRDHFARTDAHCSFINQHLGTGSGGGSTGGGSVVEGVTLTASQAAAILEIVNQATFTQLDADAGLDSRAAANLVADRPLATLDELAAVPYVGAAAITRLRDFVAIWNG